MQHWSCLGRATWHSLLLCSAMLDWVLLPGGQK